MTLYLRRRLRPNHGWAGSALVAASFALAPASALAAPSLPKAYAKTIGVVTHRIVYQVSSNDPAAMQHSLGTADNVMKFYGNRNEPVTVEIVANGGGVHMMRADTTPVAPMLAYMRSTYPNFVLTACGTTKTIMEAKEGRPLTFVEGVRVVPAGIARIVELQEQGYAYIKP